MRPGVRVVRAHVDGVSLKISGYGWQWDDICRSDYRDDEGFNWIESNGVDWQRRYHYCGMPLSEARDVAVFYPAGLASEAWAEWRATGLARVVMLHEYSGVDCPWALGPVWEEGEE